MQELVVMVVSMLSSWNVDYYPSSLQSSAVGVVYHENSTVLTINKSLVPAKIECTKSMRPMMGCGNMAYLEELSDTEDVFVGDIVAYKKDGGLIMHQVIGESDGCYNLKGFNNIFADGSCVRREDIGYRAVVVLPTGG
jgi:signal peptidase I